MKTVFGVSSVTPINKRLKNGYTMYEWVMRQKGFPKHKGRQHNRTVPLVFIVAVMKRYIWVVLSIYNKPYL